MSKATIGGAAIVTVLVLLVLSLVVTNRAPEPDEPAVATAPITHSTPMAPPRAAVADAGVIYGRVVTVDGAIHEGRLRWGGDQEAFWSDYFNGTKDENPWAVHAPPEKPHSERGQIEIFGFTIGGQDRSVKFRRLFMSRFGDIARIKAHVADVQVTLKSGTVFALDRFAAGDIDDGVRVWESSGKVVDLDARRIRTIEFLPTAALVAVPGRLHGTVRTRQRDFTGFIQWDQHDAFSADEIGGRTADGELSLRYDTIRSIERQPRDRALVTLVDGRELVLADSREIGHRNRGISVDDRRYGRVLISWDAFERVDFSPGGSGPAYEDFPPGRALAGSVTTRDGRRLTGRLVYDFDESETTETFDAPFEGVDYNIPFGSIAAIAPAGGEGGGTTSPTLMLRDGETAQFDRAGDFGERNAGLLVFVSGREHAEYVRWTDVERVDLDRPPSDR